jgi:hypothetical protein
MSYPPDLSQHTAKAGALQQLTDNIQLSTVNSNSSEASELATRPRGGRTASGTARCMA